MKVKFKFMIPVVALVLLFSACPSGGGGGGGKSSGGTATGGGGGGNNGGGGIPVELAADQYVTTIDFSGASRAIVNFENLSNDDIYLIKVNTSASNVSAGSTGSVQSSSPYFSLLYNDDGNVDERYNGKRFNASVNKRPRMGHPRADEFYANPLPVTDINGASGRLAKSASGIADKINIDDTWDFYVEKSFNSNTFEKRQAALLATGEYCKIWVMDENHGAGSSANKIDKTRAQALADQFDRIYPAETNILGYEYGGGLPVTDPNYGGKDGDPKIQILIYDIVNSSGQIMASGYFWGKDYYTQSELDAAKLNYKTNLAEIFYIDAYHAKNYLDFTCSTLIHEFQHMINFNQKSLKLGVTTQTWYNEMLSMMAEDLLSGIIGVNPDNKDHPINIYMPNALYIYDWEGITEWGVRYNIGGYQYNFSYETKYAFGAYLLRNFGGADLIKSILANNKVDEASITDALPEGVDFNMVLLRYGEALIYNDILLPVMTFNRTVTKTIGSYSYTAHGFDVWKDIFWSDGEQSTPYIYNSAQQPMRKRSIIIHQANGWKNKTGDYSTTLNKPSANIKFIMAVD